MNMTAESHRRDGISVPSHEFAPFSGTVDVPGALILTGFMGTGKTTVGDLVADMLGWKFLDMDEVICSTYGTPEDIMSAHGERGFRDLECVVAKCILEAGRGNGHT